MSLTKLAFARELKRLVIIFFIAAVVGFLSGYLWLVMSVTLVVYLLMQLYSLCIFYEFLNRPSNQDWFYISPIWVLIHASILKKNKQQANLYNELKETLENKNRLLDVWPDAMVLIDESFKIKQFNQTAEQWLGLKSVDMGESIVNFVRNQSFIRSLNNDAPSKAKIINLESPINSYQMLRLRRLKFTDEIQLLIFRDMTQFENTERMRKEFIANASHELKTPLTTIQGFAEVLASNEELLKTKDFRMAINHIQEQSCRMNEIINGLLQISRIESAQMPSFTHEIEVAKIINEEISHLKIAYPQSTIGITKLASELNIYGDERDVRSIVLNIINNALIHNTKGTNVKVSWYKSEDEAILSVEDDGRGVDSKQLMRLTERFYRVDDGRARNQGGTGLGLSIVKNALNRHGGELQMHSSLGKGLRVECIFPENRVV